MRRAYVDAAVMDSALGGKVDLPAPAVHRFIRVLRLEPGTIVEIFDGTGRIARGPIDAHGALTDVVILTTTNPLPELVLAQAMTKTEKLEQVVQKGTELGASSFWMVNCARSVVRLEDERAARRRERLARVAEDAARQSGRGTVPDVEGPIDFRTFVERVRDFPGVVLVGLLDASAPLSEVLALEQERLKQAGALMIVGPEGGLDSGEAAQLVAAKAVPVRLGAHVLRTETAGLAALAAAQVVLGHL